MAFAETALGVGSVLSGASSLWSAGSSGNMNRKNRKWQEKMYKQSLADQRENAQLQWQENRDYAKYSYDNFESPAAQRAGMAAAGINPFFQGSAIQSMGATQGSASAPEGGTLPSSGPYQFNPGSAIQPGMSAMMSGISQMQAIKASEANIELTNATRLKVLAETQGLNNANSMFDIIKGIKENEFLSSGYRRTMDRIASEYAEANAIADVDEKNARINELNQRALKESAEAAKTDSDRMINEYLKDAQKRSLESSIDTSTKQGALYEAQTKTEAAKQLSLRSEAGLADARKVTEDTLRDVRYNLENARSISESDRAALFRAEKFFTDMQGRLTESKARISEKEAEALESRAAQFMVEVGEIIKRLSPLK